MAAPPLSVVTRWVPQYVANTPASLHRPRFEVTVALPNEHDLLPAGIKERVQRDHDGRGRGRGDVDVREHARLHAAAAIQQLDAHFVRAVLFVDIGIDVDDAGVETLTWVGVKRDHGLLADEDHKLADQFGVWKEKSMYGRTYMGIERTTVLLDRNGRVARIFPKVRVPGHVEEVEAALRELDAR